VPKPRQEARNAGIPSQVWQLGWISFFADVASEMAYPILPLFMRAIGAPASAMGLVEGISESIVSFMKGASGVHSDVTGRRVPYIQAGYGLSALGKPLIALAYSWPFVLLARSLDRLGKGLRTTARDALIADSAGKQNLGRAFGLHRAMDTAGALVGVLVTVLILALAGASGHGVPLYHSIFLLALIPGAASVILTFRIREPSAEADGPRAERNKVDLKQLPPAYWRAVSLAVLFALANSSDTFLLLRGSQTGLPDTAVVLAYALYNITYTVTSYPAGALSDRIGRWNVVGAGWALYGLVYLGFAFTGAAGLWPLFALYGCYMGLTQGATKALVADYAPKGAKGTALGVFFMASGFATLLASVLMGLLWDRYGASTAFKFDAAVAGVAVLLIPLLSRRRAAA
jgi:MFS family permease